MKAEAVIMITSSSDWCADARRILTQAGWSPERDVGPMITLWKERLERAGFGEMFPAARKILAEFGGLRTEERGIGARGARSRVSFYPECAVGEEERFVLDDCPATSLFPLGEVDDGQCFLGTDREGRVFLVDQEARMIANNIYEALERLVGA